MNGYLTPSSDWATNVAINVVFAVSQDICHLLGSLFTCGGFTLYEMSSRDYFIVRNYDRIMLFRSCRCNVCSIVKGQPEGNGLLLLE